MASIKEIMEIPRLPQVSMEIIHQAFSSEPDIPRIAAIIEKDPALTAKLFQTVNSASFGLRAKVTSISQAVSIIGLDALRSSIVSIALGQYFLTNDLGNALDAKMFCIHSLATAVIMKKTAQILEIDKEDQVYLIGLLHSLGKIALDTVSDQDYLKVIERVKEGATFEEAEKQIFKVENRQIWMLLSKNWGFPEEIISLYQGVLQGSVRIKTQKMIKDASILAEHLGYNLIPGLCATPRAGASIYAGFDEDQLLVIATTVKEQVDMMSQVMDLPISTPEQNQRTFLHVIHELSKINTTYMKTHHELEYRVAELEELTKVFTGIIRSMDGDSLAFSVLEATMEGFHVDGAFLFTRKNNGGYNGYAARCDENGVPDIEHKTIAPDEICPSFEKCTSGNESIRVRHPNEESILYESLGEVNTVWLAPILVRGAIKAILGVGIKNEKSPKCTKDNFGTILNIIAGEVGLSMDNSQLFNRMQKEARVDSLTGIFNRSTIMKILASEFARYKRKPFPLTLAIFDMDNFKAINDTRGHLIGDEFLVKTARIFKQKVRESDYIGRYGGDEFIAIFPDTDPQAATIVVERIRKALHRFCKTYEGPDMTKTLSVSIGIAGAKKAMTIHDELIKHADEALYQAKATGRNRCVVFNPDVNLVT